MRDFRQLVWDDELRRDCRELVQLAKREDLAGHGDWTTLALVPPEARSTAHVVAREEGALAGVQAVRLLVADWQPDVQLVIHREDGAELARGDRILTLQGSACDMLTLERTLLNFLGRLSGIATLTARFVSGMKSASARLYDTRKTAPGWRRLEKYAVRCGGGWNHRTGLFDAILIKDNHLALGAELASGCRFTPSDAVARARSFLRNKLERREISEMPIVEIELDSLAEFDAVLDAQPDIILLDNMPPALLREAVERRNARSSGVQLEASGGVRLTTVGEIAATGVDRISCGALTHSAVNFDVGLDWETG